MVVVLYEFTNKVRKGLEEFENAVHTSKFKDEGFPMVNDDMDEWMERFIDFMKEQNDVCE